MNENLNTKQANEADNTFYRHEALVSLPPNTFLNADCMDYLPKCPSGYFDLAIVDPPYGNNLSGGRSAKDGWNPNIDWNKCNKGWNLNIPNKNYFEELRRVSKNQIIWGGNYFANLLPNTECWLVWDKGQREFSLADGELAWASFDKALRIITYPRALANQEEKIHPTQKPVELYKRILRRFAEAGHLILDTHVGSGSSLVACKELGLDYIGFEIDEDYYEAASKRVAGAFRKYELQF